MSNLVVKNKTDWSKKVEFQLKENKYNVNINILIKLIIEYKISSSESIFEKIVYKLNGLIRTYLTKVSYYYKDDFKQELLIGIYKAVKAFRINDDLIPKDDVCNLCSNRFVINFNNKYGNEFFTAALLDDQIMTDFINELILFCNENQFIRYITKTFDNTYIEHLRKNCLEINNMVISFDFETIVMENTFNDITNGSLLHREITFNEEELKFINLFIENGNVLSEREVGLKLGISQQAVHKRKKAICKKYQVKNNS